MSRSSLRQSLAALRHAAHGLGLLASCLVLSQAAVSCGDGEDSKVCLPGAAQSCLGTGSCDGTQMCLGDGSGFSECDCTAAGDASGGSGGDSAMTSAGTDQTGEVEATTMTGSLTEATEPPPLRGYVGWPCETSADCPSGEGGETLDCITPSDTGIFGNGGPQDGYCSLPCTAGGTECSDMDDNSECEAFDEVGNGTCWALCNPGPDPEAVKCRAPAQACIPQQGTGFGLCGPVCQSDEQCGEGLFCTRQGPLSLCTTEAPGTGAIGSECSQETEAEDCNGGLCVIISLTNAEDSPTASYCSANCTRFVRDACGAAPEGTTVRDATCLGPQFDGASAGDLGYCIELCDTDEDCEQESFGCEPSTAIFNAERRSGACIPLELLSGAGAPEDAGTGLESGEDAGSN